MLNQVVHIIGGAEDSLDEALATAMTLVVKRPGDWHPKLVGEIPRRVMCDAPNLMTRWASAQNVEVVDASGVEEIMCGVLVSRDRAHLSLAAFYVEIGIPIIGIDLENTDIYALFERDLTQWFNNGPDSQYKGDGGAVSPVQYPFGGEQGLESHFLPGSDNIAEDASRRSAMMLRDGDRCRFTRSRVEKAG